MTASAVQTPTMLALSSCPASAKLDVATKVDLCLIRPTANLSLFLLSSLESSTKHSTSQTANQLQPLLEHKRRSQG